MKWPRLSASLPLLRKELIEQAARPRTYAIRVIYATLLFSIFLALSYQGLKTKFTPETAGLGSGEDMFANLLYIQFAGILLFLPATMSSVITSEKERQSLALLLLTDLRPAEILWQKYIGRLVPMLTCLLLSLPLLALCFAFGGISTDYVLSGICALFLTCLQVGALSILCSCFFATSLSAFVASYIWMLVLFGFAPWFITNATSVSSSGGLLGYAFFSLFFTGVFLAGARVCLVSRAFLPPRNVLLDAFRKLDAFFRELNRGFGGVLVLKESDTLPTDQPVAWREVSKRSLGRVVYLFRVFILFETPVAAAVAFSSVDVALSGRIDGVSVVLFVIWVLAALAVTVTSANAIGGERTRQTLDVLLTTPVSGSDIVRQKLRAVRRLTCVLLLPFLTAILVKWWWAQGDWRYSQARGHASYYLIASLTTLLYLPLASWFGAWVALRVKARLRAVLIALIVLVVWNGLPPLLYALVPESEMGWVQLLSPAATIVLVESFAGRWAFAGYATIASVAIAVNLVVHGCILLGLRIYCLGAADRLLGRATPRPEGAEPPQDWNCGTLPLR